MHCRTGSCAMDDGVPRCRIVDGEWKRGAGGAGQVEEVDEEPDATGAGQFYNIETLQRDDVSTDGVQEEGDESGSCEHADGELAGGGGPHDEVSTTSEEPAQTKPVGLFSSLPTADSEWVPPAAATDEGVEGVEGGDDLAGGDDGGEAQKAKGEKPLPPRFQPPGNGRLPS